MGKIYHKGASVVCPHCDEKQESKVEDYFGENSQEDVAEDQCWYCDEFFVVVAIDDDVFEIRDASECDQIGSGFQDEDDEDD